jgi:large subunit ribosomal protein L24
MNTLHIKKGDTVVVISGAEKGKSGKVLETYPKWGTVLVEGVGMRKKHQRPRKAGQHGQIIDKQTPIRASKVMEAGRHKEKASKKKKK